MDESQEELEIGTIIYVTQEHYFNPKTPPTPYIAKVVDGAINSKIVLRIIIGHHPSSTHHNWAGEYAELDIYHCEFKILSKP